MPGLTWHPENYLFILFLEEFSAIANASGEVERLREMILQLTVIEKVVEQNPEDKFASRLLKGISEKKAKHNRTNEIKINR